MVAFSGNNTLPDGWLLCNGAAVSRETYAALYSAIGDTYGAGDGSATFNLPNLTDKFIEGSSTSGTEHSAGLPNIDGYANITAGNVQWSIGDGSGALTYKDNTSTAANISVTGTQPVTGYGVRLKIDASQSNPIYGNSNTVQPPALTMRFAIFAGHSGLFRWIRTV